MLQKFYIHMTVHFSDRWPIALLSVTYHSDYSDKARMLANHESTGILMESLHCYDQMDRFVRHFRLVHDVISCVDEISLLIALQTLSSTKQRRDPRKFHKILLLFYYYKNVTH